jgi:phage shock protein PspC (stress-responsive transcriptional regulator)
VSPETVDFISVVVFVLALSAVPAYFIAVAIKRAWQDFRGKRG